MDRRYRVLMHSFVHLVQGKTVPASNSQLWMLVGAWSYVSTHSVSWHWIQAAFLPRNSARSISVRDGLDMVAKRNAAPTDITSYVVHLTRKTHWQKIRICIHPVSKRVLAQTVDCRNEECGEFLVPAASARGSLLRALRTRDPPPPQMEESL
jgi:hypothetical protein